MEFVSVLSPPSKFRSGSRVGSSGLLLGRSPLGTRKFVLGVPHVSYLDSGVLLCYIEVQSPTLNLGSVTDVGSDGVEDRIRNPSSPSSS